MYDKAVLEVEFRILGVDNSSGGSRDSLSKSSFLASKSGGGVFNQSHLEKEGAQFVKQSLMSSICLGDFPRMVIVLQVCVVQDEGSRLSCAVNASTLAFLNAGIPMLQIPCSLSVGVMRSISAASDKDSELLILDTSSAEENSDTRQCVATLTVLPKRNGTTLKESVICSELRGSNITIEDVKLIEELALSTASTVLLPFMCKCTQGM
jgi:hypothetical protein